jgi:hypothetical protein
MFFSTGTNSNFQLAPSRLFNILPLSIDSFAEKSPFMSETASNTFQVGGSKIYFRQESTTQIDTTQIGTTQINSPQLNIPQDGTTQIYLRKLPLSPRISIDQFFNSHNVSHQNTTVLTWIEFLQETNPFNLKIEIIDLPTGQLAEANITGLDPTGRPNAGTLTLDTNANGHGWCIDAPLGITPNLTKPSPTPPTAPPQALLAFIQ